MLVYLINDDTSRCSFTGSQLLGEERVSEQVNASLYKFMLQPFPYLSEYDTAGSIFGLSEYITADLNMLPDN